MPAAIDPSIYEVITLESSATGKSIDVRLGVVNIQYFEDVFSPTITMKMAVVNSGPTIKDDQGKSQSIYSGLPLRGGERVAVKIANKSGTLDFTTPEKYFYVSSISGIVRDGQRELFTLELCSREAITNETSVIQRRFSTDLNMVDSVKIILKDYLKVDLAEKPLIADKTKHSYGFLGNLKKPFSTLVWLASKAMPERGLAGFFFFETKRGFNFRSIDSLIKNGIDEDADNKIITYTEVNVSDNIAKDDFRILNYSITRNNDLLKKLRYGTFGTVFTMFNPLDYSFTPAPKTPFSSTKRLTEDDVTTLGEEYVSPEIRNDAGISVQDIPTRIISAVSDVGAVEKDAKDRNINGRPDEHYKESLLRYNLLFTQVLNLTVPLNVNLCAGDVIKCKFQKVSEMKDFDREQTGLYMIKEICHSFDPERSVTSMKLVRDTFGQAFKD